MLKKPQTLFFWTWCTDNILLIMFQFFVRQSAMLHFTLKADM